MSGPSQDLASLIIADARALSPSAFCQKHGYPFLIGDEKGVSSGQPSPSETSCMTTMIPGNASPLAEPLAFFPSIILAVRKLEGTTESPDLVTVGRAPGNDVHLEVQTISKLHAHFVRKGARWSLLDGHSQNGTFVQGERMPQGGERFLQDGDAVAFGPDSRFRFFEPRTLYHMVRGFVEPGKG